MKALLLLPLLLIGACKAEKAADKKDDAGTKAAKVEKNSSVLMKTSMGDITIELNGKKAPITVANFLKYVDAKFYDGTIYHRVMNNFMIQGGGFAVNDDIPTEKENNDPIKNEGQNGLTNDRGTLAMARTSDINSATSQFFINVVDNAGLNFPNNGGYAVFAKVTKGMEVVDQIKAVKTGTKYMNSRLPNGKVRSGAHQNVPVKPVTILSIRRIK